MLFHCAYRQYRVQKRGKRRRMEIVSMDPGDREHGRAPAQKTKFGVKRGAERRIDKLREIR